MTSAKQVSAQYTQEFKLEAVRQVKAGQAIAVVAKVLGIPKASLRTWVRLVTQGKLDCGEVTGKGCAGYAPADGASSFARRGGTSSYGT